MELTYGLERFAMALQGVDNVYDLQWAPGVTYRDVRLRDEVEQSKYAFGQVDVPEGEFAEFHREHVRSARTRSRKHLSMRSWCCRRSTTA